MKIYSAMYLHFGDVSPTFGDVSPAFGDVSPAFGDISPPFEDISPNYISILEIYLLQFDIYFGDISLIYLHYISIFQILEQIYIFQSHFHRFFNKISNKIHQRYISKTFKNGKIYLSSVKI